MADLFDIGLETDLSEFDSTVTDGGDLSQSGAAALAGTLGGMQCVIDDTASIYGRMVLSSLTRFRCREYIDINTLTMASGDRWHSSFDPSSNLTLEIRYSGTVYQIRFFTATDTGSTNTSLYTFSDEPHYVEYDWKASSSPGADDGFLSFWVDGALQETLSSLDNDTITLSERRWGARSIDAGTSGTFYIDEIKANDDGSEIGPLASSIIPIFYHHNQNQGIT